MKRSFGACSKQAWSSCDGGRATTARQAESDDAQSLADMQSYAQRLA